MIVTSASSLERIEIFSHPLVRNEKAGSNMYVCLPRMNGMLSSALIVIGRRELIATLGIEMSCRLRVTPLFVELTETFLLRYQTKRDTFQRIFLDLLTRL